MHIHVQHHVRYVVSHSNEIDLRSRDKLPFLDDHFQGNRLSIVVYCLNGAVVYIDPISWHDMGFHCYASRLLVLRPLVYLKNAFSHYRVRHLVSLMFLHVKKYMTHLQFKLSKSDRIGQACSVLGMKLCEWYSHPRPGMERERSVSWSYSVGAVSRRYQGISDAVLHDFFWGFFFAFRSKICFRAMCKRSTALLNSIGATSVANSC